MINLFLGSSVADQSDSQFNNRVWKLVGTFSSVFESAAKLLHTAIPLPLADRLNLKIWRDFERATLETLEICKSAVSAAKLAIFILISIPRSEQFNFHSK